MINRRGKRTRFPPATSQIQTTGKLLVRAGKSSLPTPLGAVQNRLNIPSRYDLCLRVNVCLVPPLLLKLFRWVEGNTLPSFLWLCEVTRSLHLSLCSLLVRSLHIPLAAPSPVWTWEWQVRAPPRGGEEKRVRERKRGKGWRNPALTALAQGVAGRYIACRVQRIIAALISAHAYAGTHTNTCLVTL